MTEKKICYYLDDGTERKFFDENGDNNILTSHGWDYCETEEFRKALISYDEKRQKELEQKFPDWEFKDIDEL